MLGCGISCSCWSLGAGLAAAMGLLHRQKLPLATHSTARAQNVTDTDLDHAGVMQALDPQALLALLACPAPPHLVQRMPAAVTGWLRLPMLALQCAAQH